MTEMSSADHSGMRQPTQEVSNDASVAALRILTNDELTLILSQASWEMDDPDTVRICQAELDRRLGITE